MGILKELLNRWINASGFSFNWTVPRGWLMNRANRRHRLGQGGEDLAAEFLQGMGYRILVRGSRTAYGEIDLIALDHDCLVFVEVKTLRQVIDQDPSAAVGTSKQAKMTRAALAYLRQKRLMDRRTRFDVVSIVGDTDSPCAVRIRHFKHAFEATGNG